MRVFANISHRREFEFGIAIGSTNDWIDERKVVSVRLSFGKRALVFTFRGEQK